MQLTLPFPPSVNKYYRHVVIKGHARVLMSQEGRAYRDACLACVLSEHGVLRPLTGRLQVRIWLYPPDRRVIDIDNRLKSLLDSLTHCRVIEDDSLIDRIELERCGVAKPGKAVVSVEPARDEGE